MKIAGDTGDTPSFTLEKRVTTPPIFAGDALVTLVTPLHGALHTERRRRIASRHRCIGFRL